MIILKKRMALYARSALTLLKIAFVKLFNVRSFFSPPAQDFSLTTKISAHDNGKITLGARIHTKRNVVFEADGGALEIGSGCFFNNGCMVVAKERVQIGSYSSFGPNVLIYDHDHVIDEGSIHDSGFATAPVVIGNNVWIGAGCVILRGTVIGDDCVVGAGSVVKGVYEPGTVVIQKRAETLRSRGAQGKETEKEVDVANG